MKHYIIVKFKEGTDTAALAEPVRRIFAETLAIPGIHGAQVRVNCTDRPNRCDLMIEMDMDREALPAYDVSEPHLRWKKEYGDLIAFKAIFDCE